MESLDISREIFKDLAVVKAVLNCQKFPVAVLSPEGEILATNQQYEEQFGQGKGVVGRYCHEVSHGLEVPCWQQGEACPLRLSRRLGQSQRCVHVHHTPDGEVHHDVQACPVIGEGGKVLGYLESIQPTRIATPVANDKGLVGRSMAFNRMLEMLQRVAPSETTVLLLGESGTGKELAAQAVHALSRRCTHPFVALDCSGLVESLFESELFGHEKGAFTGAYTRKVGLVESANGGTLFLDEVGDLSPSLQVKLLRLIETGTYRRVGSVDSLRADVRLICATHRDLQRMVDEGTFRADLYYRISAFPVRLPALRERPEDIELLSRSMMMRIAPTPGECKLDPSTMETLRAYAFPGNIRELRNILDRAILLADGNTIFPEHLPEDIREGTSDFSPVPPTGKILPLEEMEQRYLEWAASRFTGDRSDLARMLGLGERTLYRKLQRLRSNRPK